MIAERRRCSYECQCRPFVADLCCSPLLQYSSSERGPSEQNFILLQSRIEVLLLLEQLVSVQLEPIH